VGPSRRWRSRAGRVIGVVAARSTTPRRRGARDEPCFSGGYFFAWQRLVDACQSPPSFSQSAWLWIVESEGEAPLEDPLPVEGLADGDVDEPDEGEPGDDGVDIEPVLEPDPLAPLPPVAPVLDGPLVEPAAPLLLPVPAPPPVCAAARAGAKQIIPIKTRESIFFIRFLLAVWSEGFSLPRGRR